MSGIISLIYSLQYKGRQKAIGQLGRCRKFFYKQTAPRIDIKTFAPKKVLFIVCGLLGDSVMCIPTITEARRIWQNSRFTVLVKKHNHELLYGNPDIDEFYECDADPLSLRKSGEVKNLQNWLNAENFDVSIILGIDQYAHLLAKAKIPVRVGVENSVLESYLTHTYDIISPKACAANERLNALRCLGYKVENVLPKLYVAEAAKKSAGKKLVSCGLGSEENYAVLHPFGSTPNQWWNIKNVEPLAKKLYEKHNLRLVLVGKKYNLNGVVVTLPSEEIDDFVIDTTGKLSLPELVAIIDGSKLVITTDSGPFHIAGALQKTTIGLFRARRPEHSEHYPTATTILGFDETCQMKCKWDYCRLNPCKQLSDISVDSVMKELGKRLK